MRRSGFFVRFALLTFVSACLALSLLCCAAEGSEPGKEWPYEAYAYSATGGIKPVYAALSALLLGAFILKKILEKRSQRALFVRHGERIDVLLLLSASFALRLFAATATSGLKYDMNCFMSWGRLFREVGFRFYANDYFHDYPPLYVVMLGGMENVRLWLNIGYGTHAHSLLIRLLPVLADMATAILMYALVRKKSKKGALMLLAAFAFNPAYLFDSAIWGQADSILCLMLIAVVILARRGRWTWALTVYALSLLMKPQALLFGPIGLVALLIDIKKNPTHIKGVLWGLGAALLTVTLPSAPFAYYEGQWKNAEHLVLYIVKWPWMRLIDTTNSQSSLTRGAFNLYYLLGQNGKSASGALNVFSWGMFAASYLIAAVTFMGFRHKAGGQLALAGAVLMALLFCFTPRMHERYLMPVLGLSMLAFIEGWDRRLITCFGVFSLCQRLNMVMIYAKKTVLAAGGSAVTLYTWSARVVCVLTILCCAALC